MDADTESDLISINRKESEWKSAFEEAVRVRDRQLENIKKQLIGVKSELNTSKSQLTKKNKELDDCNHKIQELTSEVNYECLRCEEMRKNFEKMLQTHLENLDKEWEKKFTLEKNVWQTKWEDQRAKYISSTFQLTKQLKKEIDEMENQLENEKLKGDTIKEKYESLQNGIDVKNKLVKQQQCIILKIKDEFNKIQQKHNQLLHENIKFKENFKVLQNNLIELKNENKSLKLVNNNEIIKKVSQMESLIKARLIVKDKELNLLEDIKYIKQEIKKIKKDTKVITVQEPSEKNMVCNTIKEKAQYVQTDVCISNSASNFNSIHNYRDEIFSLKEEILQYKDKIKSYETQLAEIIKQNLVLREIIKEFKKEYEKIKNEESEAEVDEKYIKQLEENIQLLKENMMQNAGRVGTDIWQTVEKMKKEISVLKIKSLTQVT